MSEGVVNAPRTLAADAAAHLSHPLTRLLLTLTFTTGMIDAASYLGLGRVFTANMTGNVVLLGFGIAGTGGLPVLSPLVSLGAFTVGSRFGGMLAASLADRHGRHVGSALAIEAALVVLAAIVLSVSGVHPDSFSADAVIALLALGMGVRNATVRKLAVPDLTTTVLTSTITGLAAEFSLRRGSPGATSTARRASAVATMLAGALVGALLVKSSVALTVAAVAALVLICLFAYVPPRWHAAAEAA